MVRALLFSTLIMFSAVSFAAGAKELNNESSITNEQIRKATSLPATVVVRTNMATGQVDVLQLKDVLPGAPSSQKELLARANDFKVVSKDVKLKNELDQDSSTNSWYFFFYNTNYSYPSYAYSGYTYRYYPYYNFWNGGYAYNCYRWYW